jgi:hypothetical protein
MSELKQMTGIVLQVIDGQSGPVCLLVMFCSVCVCE